MDLLLRSPRPWTCYPPQGIFDRLVTGSPIALPSAVLSAIYGGLGDMATNPGGPSASMVPFPTSFLYGCIALHFKGSYVLSDIPSSVSSTVGLKDMPEMTRIMDRHSGSFNPHKARTYVRYEPNFDWQIFPSPYSSEGWFADDRNAAGILTLPRLALEYMLSLRHSVLPLRMEGRLSAEPYNPHRFARQFGYDQSFSAFYDVPRRSLSLGTISGYWLYHSTVGTSSRFFAPKRDRVGRLSLHYASHWAESMGAYFSQGVKGLARPKKVNVRGQNKGASRDKNEDFKRPSATQLALEKDDNRTVLYQPKGLPLFYGRVSSGVDLYRSTGKRPLSPLSQRDSRSPRLVEEARDEEGFEAF